MYDILIYVLKAWTQKSGLHAIAVCLATKWLRILSLGGNAKIRSHLIANRRNFQRFIDDIRGVQKFSVQTLPLYSISRKKIKKRSTKRKAWFIDTKVVSMCYGIYR